MGNKISCPKNGKANLLETPISSLYTVQENNTVNNPDNRKTALIQTLQEDDRCSSSISGSSTSSSLSSHSSHKQRRQRDKHRKDTKASSLSGTSSLMRTSPVPENPSEAMQVVLDWIKAKNKQNVMQMYRFADESAQFHFPDTNMKLPMRKFWDAMMGVFQGIPDFSFSYSDIEEPTAGTVVLTNYAGAGYHKGFFAFGDNSPIPPTGAYLASDPVKLTVHVDLERQKITGLVAVTMIEGGLAGPLGLYIKAKNAFLSQQGES